jgi:hypothetical protein
MPRLIRSGLLLGALLCALPACGGTAEAEDLAGEQTDIITGIAELAESIEDKQSFQAAEAEMRKLGERMKQLKADVEGLIAEGSTTREQMETYLDEHAEQWKAASKRASAAFMKLMMDPDLRGDVQQLLTELGNQLGDAFNP